MAGYGVFAEFYDRLTDDVGYSDRTDYLLSLFERFDRRPKLLLDLACGTGGFSFEMADRGIEVIGVDNSPDMLSVAKSKAGEREDVLFICQSAENLELYSSVEGAVCCLDSVNHFSDSAMVKAAFEKVADHMEEGRLFIFDINSLYKHKNILGNNTFVYDTEEVYLVWQNELEDEHDVNIYLDFFCPRGETYERYSEEFTEKGYSADEMTALLEKAGFKTLAVYEDMTEEPAKETSERIIFVAKRAKPLVGEKRNG